MAKFKLLERAYINDRILEADTVIGDGTANPFDGVPGPHMEPVDDEAKKLMAAWREQNPGATLDVMSKLTLREQASDDPIERLARMLAPLVGAAGQHQPRR